MSAAVGSLVAALLAQHAPAAAHATPPADSALEDAVMAQDESVRVELVSKQGAPELVHVNAFGTPVHEILVQLAKLDQRVLRVEAGEAALFSTAAVDAHLKHRPLEDAIEWIAGAAGLYADRTRGALRLQVDRSDSVDPEVAARRAVAGWRNSLARDPLQVDAPRLRFQIGNALYQLGDFKNAAVAWTELESSATQWRQREAAHNEGGESADPAAEFADLPLVYYRCGHAYAALGDEKSAQNQWLLIPQKFAESAYVADARLQAVRSFRRQGDTANANLMLRLVIETQSRLSPTNMIEAGELLNEGGSHERATTVIELALATTNDERLKERGCLALARSDASLQRWDRVVTSAKHYVKAHANGRHAAEMWLLLGKAHHHFEDPFTALLAARRVRELLPTEEIGYAADLLEGRIWADCGLRERADVCLERAAGSSYPRLAIPAIELRVELLQADGQLEAAARLCARWKELPGQSVNAAIRLAHICLLQRNRARCLSLVHETFRDATDEQRAELNDIANEALRDAPADVAIPEFLDGPTAPVVPENDKEHADGH